MRSSKLPPLTGLPQPRMGQLDVPHRLLLGPGPSNVHPRTMQALGMPTIGHLDAKFVEFMGEIQDLLRYVWQTRNETVLAVSGTGSAGMEAAIANVVEPGDVVLVGVNGYFGERICEMMRRYGADLRRLEAPWGKAFDVEQLRHGLATHRPAVLALVHGETSTGVEQPLAEAGRLCREYDALLLVDSVASLGGVPLYLDAWQVDICYSASQKCLSSPPGVAPLTVNERAWAKVRNRATPVRSWYFDLNLLRAYWEDEHIYHHTAPIHLYYALRESLRLVADEGLAECWQRHRSNAELLWLGLSDLDLTCFVDHPHRLASLTTVKVPSGSDAQAVARYLLDHYNIDIAGGLGGLRGQIWRIGLMGFNSRASNVALLLNGLEEALHQLR